MMQTETTTSSAVIIPFPKRRRASASTVKTASGHSVPTLGSPQPEVFVRPLPPAPTAIIGRATSPVSLSTTLPPARQTPTTSTRSGAAPLSGVMAELDHALTQQGAAVARWRRAINDLRVAMDGLEGSLKQYRDSLAPKTNNGAAG